MNRFVRQSGAVLGAAVVFGSLAACGSSASEASPEESVTPATQAQLDAYLKSTNKDVAALEKKLKSAYKKNHSFPASPNGLITVSAHNRIQTYKRETDAEGGHVVRICVEHVEKQPNPNDTKQIIDQVLTSTDTSVGVYSTGKFMKFTPGTSKGAGSECS